MADYARRFLTVTEVRVTYDLQFADVWVSVIGEKSRRVKEIRRLSEDAYRIRMALAGRVYLRRLPELRFHLDDTLDQAEKIDNLLKTSLEKSSDTDD